ncbi:MAG: adenosylhomocysteinase, partial [Candidatus Micrarchaeota archaeon]
MGKVKDSKLAGLGEKELLWARERMPMLGSIRKRFEKEKPLNGITLGTCLHLEKKTGVLLETLKAGGAKVYSSSCNPLTTDDSVAAALAKEGIEVFAWAGQTNDEYYTNINAVLDGKPDAVIDDGCDQIFALHKNRRELLPNIKGGCEETTTGVSRLKAMEKEGKLEFPVIAVNNAYSKYLFDNRFGTGQSTIDGIMRATNVLIAGKNAVVVGFGWCGRGIADRLRGLGANVTVVEITDRIRKGEPSGMHKALEALYSGYRVMDMKAASKFGDIFISATGCKNAIGEEHLKLMKSGAILANAGHFDNEIDKEYLGRNGAKKNIKTNLDEFTLKDGRKLYLLSEGRLVNLSQPTGQGHPIEIMDGSFAIQALSLEYLLKNDLKKGVHDVPLGIDDYVAGLALESNGVKLSALTKEQMAYL